MRSLVAFLLLSFHLIASAQSSNRTRQDRKLTREEYIDYYAPFAVKEMLISGVPASITLAQGILESGDGNSLLAREANNHFGIKCHGLWEGKKYYMDDDAENECFRVYGTVFDSYRDHSEFLGTRSRYADLFKLKRTDYKGWAKGLKKAGYATNPKYPALLIRIIEENRLDRYDRMKTPPKGKLELPEAARKGNGEKHPGDMQEAIVSPYQRQLYMRNDTRYVRAEEGDTYKSLERLLEMRHWQIMRYNDKQSGSPLVLGEIIYLQPKRSRNPDHRHHIMAEGETLRWVSQEYAVKLKKLYRYNDLSSGREPPVGQKVWLRRPKRKKGKL